MGVELLVAGFDSARENQRMGAGPAALRSRSVDALTLDPSGPVVVRVCHPRQEWRAELCTGFELQQIVSEYAASVFARGHRPVLLSGNCNTMLGVVAAAEAHAGPVTVVWFDAHGDANSPEYDAAGFLDGHALSMLTGHAWQAATAQIPGFCAVPGSRVVHVGGRDFNPGERDRMRSWGIRMLAPDQLAGYRWEQTLGSCERVHLHLDLDVLDPELVGSANSYAAPNGVSTDELRTALAVLAGHASMTSLSLASYDPASDPSGAIPGAVHQLLRTVALAWTTDDTGQDPGH